MGQPQLVPKNLQKTHPTWTYWTATMASWLLLFSPALLPGNRPNITANLPPNRMFVDWIWLASLSLVEAAGEDNQQLATRPATRKPPFDILAFRHLRGETSMFGIFYWCLNMLLVKSPKYTIYCFLSQRSTSKFGHIILINIDLYWVTRNFPCLE